MNKIQIIGGERDGQFMDWIGNRVSINGVDHVLHRATYLDGSKREYYIEATALIAEIEDGIVARIEVLG